ncbi:MAG: hypothetical protein ACNYPI_08075 [Arenicellales bacterium WSBS_2016_MAG_OTU3]
MRTQTSWLDYFPAQCRTQIAMANQQQTHKLPESGNEQQRLAFTMGFEDWATFSLALGHVQQRVAKQFAKVFGDDKSDDKGDDKSETRRLLGQPGGRMRWTPTTRQGCCLPPGLMIPNVLQNFKSRRQTLSRILTRRSQESR